MRKAREERERVKKFTDRGIVLGQCTKQVQPVVKRQQPVVNENKKVSKESSKVVTETPSQASSRRTSEMFNSGENRA